MKKLFTLVALLAMFLGAKAETIEDVFIDFSTVSELKLYGWGGSESARARLSLLDGCLHFHSEEATDPSWDCQFFPVGGVDVEVGQTYTMTLMMKGDHAANMSAVSFGGLANYGNLAVPTEWTEITIMYENVTGTDGNVLFQCGDYVGDWDIKWIKITHEGKKEAPIVWNELLLNGDAEKSWADLGLADVAFDDMDNNMKVCFWTKEKGVNENNPHPAEIIQEADGNHAFICRATTADTEGDAAAWDNQIWLQAPRAWKTGEQFRLMFRYKASEPVVTNTQVHNQKPSDYLYWQAVGDVNFTTEWQQFEQIFTVPSDANGMWSVAFNLNPNVKTPVDFYIDDISWGEMQLEHGLFITAANTSNNNVEYDFASAASFVYDENMDAMAARVGEPGNDGEKWVNEVMISTVRGNDRQFKANTLKNKGAVLASFYDPAEENWVNFEEGSNAKIKLPAAGVWDIYVDEEAGVMAFYQVEGDVVLPPVEVVPNENEFVIKTVERTMSLDEAKAAGLIADPENPTDEEKAQYSGQPWDNQFFIIGNRALEVGEEVFVSFDYMATAPATVGTQNSKNAGDYLHWAGLGNIEFTTEWQSFETTVTIPAETSGNQNSWTFNLSNAQAANEFHIKNIVFCNADKTETFIDMEGTSEANFMKKVGANTAAIPADADPDAIKNVTNTKVTTNAMFNLAGQRVSKDFKGIAIKNGQKFIVK